MSGDFAVIGIGRLGHAVATRLAAQGQSVLAVDCNLELVQSVAPHVDSAICADATDEAAFSELALDQYRCAIVAVGADAIEASILVTALLKQAGIPRIVSRAITSLHARVLFAVGANEVINPEQSMGEQLADRLCNPNLLSRLEFDDGSTLAELDVPQAFVGKTLIDLGVRARYSVTVVGVRHKTGPLASPKPDDPFRDGDMMLILGKRDAVERVGNLA
jgi:trk system potassium uptake protein TrkA